MNVDMLKIFFSNEKWLPRGDKMVFCYCEFSMDLIVSRYDKSYLQIFEFLPPKSLDALDLN